MESEVGCKFIIINWMKFWSRTEREADQHKIINILLERLGAWKEY